MCRHIPSQLCWEPLNCSCGNSTDNPGLGFSHGCLSSHSPQLGKRTARDLDYKAGLIEVSGYAHPPEILNTLQLLMELRGLRRAADFR